MGKVGGLVGSFTPETGKTTNNRLSNKDRNNKDVSEPNHGNVAAVCFTNGIGFKAPDRVGDLLITGVGAYADNAVAVCGGTGDGDVMMHFLSCF